MLVTATKIVEAPGVVTAQQKSVTGTAPEPPTPASAATPQASEVATAKGEAATGTIQSGSLTNAPLLIATGEPTPAPAEAEAPAETSATPAAPAPSYLSWIKWVVILLVIWLLSRFIRSKSKG